MLLKYESRCEKRGFNASAISIDSCQPALSKPGNYSKWPLPNQSARGKKNQCKRS